MKYIVVRARRGGEQWMLAGPRRAAESKGNDVTRIDAHQHYWKLARGDYGWLRPEAGALYRDYLPADLESVLSDCSIAGTVLVQAAPSEAETCFMLDLARRHRSILGVVGWVDFESRAAGKRIAALKAQGDGLLKGLRPMVQDIEDAAWLARESLDAAFEALIGAGLVFDALVTPLHLGVLEQRLARHPDLRCVVDHGGKPSIGAAPLDTWAAHMKRIATGSSAFCKLSGLVTQCNPTATLDALDPYVSHLFEYFGPDRIVWGSDWPVLNLRMSYREWLEMAIELVQRHAPGASEAVFSRNARRLYGLDLATPEDESA
jgi:L-fuconolactonase